MTGHIKLQLPTDCNVEIFAQRDTAPADARWMLDVWSTRALWCLELADRTVLHLCSRRLLAVDIHQYVWRGEHGEQPGKETVLPNLPGVNVHYEIHLHNVRLWCTAVITAQIDDIRTFRTIFWVSLREN